MSTASVLLLAWFAVVLLWLLNNFYYTNQKHDLEYRRARAKEKQEQAAQGGE